MNLTTEYRISLAVHYFGDYADACELELLTRDHHLSAPAIDYRCNECFWLVPNLATPQPFYPAEVSDADTAYEFTALCFNIVNRKNDL